MIRIFPDFSVQVTASGPGGGGGGGGMLSGPPVGRVPVSGATNGSPQSVQGITAYQQRYVRGGGQKQRTDLLCSPELPLLLPRGTPAGLAQLGFLTQWT